MPSILGLSWICSRLCTMVKYHCSPPFWEHLLPSSKQFKQIQSNSWGGNQTWYRGLGGEVISPPQSGEIRCNLTTCAHFFPGVCATTNSCFFFLWKVYTICGPRFTNQGAWHFIQFRWWYDWVISSMPHQKHARHARAGGCHVLWWGLYITKYADRDIQSVVIDTLPKTNMSPEK